MHPLRASAPVKGQCTRSERVQCLRIGCTTPSVTSPHADLPEWTSTDPTGAGHRDGRAWRGFETTRRAGGSRRVACAAPNPSAGLTHNEPGRGAHMRRGRGQPRDDAQPSPGLVFDNQTRRSTMRFAKASSAVLASPLGSGASAAIASLAHVRASSRVSSRTS